MQRSSFPAHAFRASLYAAMAFIFHANSCVVSLAIGANFPRYTFVDLGTLGGTFSSAYAINASGQVVGDAELADGNSHAFVYSGGTMMDLGSLSAGHSVANAINSSGQITGLTIVGSSTHAFLYSAGQMRDIGFSVGLGINDAGVVVGNESGVFTKAFRYSNNSFIYLPTLGGGGSFAHDISNSGYIVGNSGVARIPDRPFDFPHHAFRYLGGQMTDLGVLGSGPNSFAEAVNESGVVVGYSDTVGASTHHAFLYQNGTMTDLGTLGYPRSRALGINNYNQVVGALNDGSGTEDGFLFTNGQMYKLVDLIRDAPAGWRFSAADINDLGWIAGSARINGGSIHAVLLIPIPEPATAALFTIGFSSVALRRNRRSTLNQLSGRRSL